MASADRADASGGRGAIVLCYHRITTTSFDPYGLGIQVTLFRRHMETLAREFAIIPFEELVTRAANNDAVLSRVASVTFDDGYADNYHLAFPILQTMGIPATIFLTTDYVDRSAPFWWDRLAWLVYRTGRQVLAIPEELGGNTADISSLERAKQALDQLRRTLRGLDDGGRRDRLLDQMGAEDPPEDVRPLSWQQVKDMQPYGIRFGAHTRTHPSLRALSDEAVQREVVGSRDAIRLQLGEQPTVFAYPFGHADERIAGILGAAGFHAGATTTDGMVCRGSSPYFLPRVVVGNWRAAYLAKALAVLRTTGYTMGSPSSHAVSALKSVLPLRVLQLEAKVRFRLITGSLKGPS